MNQRFFDVKKEKQDRIINAGLKVFARAGYRHASTDEVVKTAGISKGLLFHYFGSKLGLYGFLYDYSSRFMLLELRQELLENDRKEAQESGNPDEDEGSKETLKKGSFFAFVRHREAAFMRIYRLYPYMRRFLEMAELEDCVEAAEAVGEMRRGYRKELLELEAGVEAAGEKEAEGVLPEAGEEKEQQMEARAVELTIRSLVEEESRKPGYTPEGLYRQICEYLDLFEKAFGR